VPTSGGDGARTRTLCYGKIGHRDLLTGCVGKSSRPGLIHPVGAQPEDTPKFGLWVEAMETVILNCLFISIN
jgi:hypothetical protein